MNTDIAIKVENITKSYRLYASSADRLKEAFHPFRKKYHDSFNALTDVSFEVKRGDSVGIVGRNGSGKSTLLQIISGVIQPSSGSIQVNGRISALLELGSGFNPDFTGRQNVYLNAAILGLKQVEINRKMDEILAFADINQFIDQPVKTYSSGMMMRLAFAVQAAVEPDIFIVDEALSVGDEAFQRKCFARLENLRNRGTTLLFVSHSAGTVVSLCNSAIMLRNGRVFVKGSPKSVVTIYQKSLFSQGDSDQELLREFELMESRDSTRIEPCSPSCNGTGAEPYGLKNQRDCEEPSFYDPDFKAQVTVEYPTNRVRIIDPHIETLAGRRVNNLVWRGEYVYTYRVHFFEDLAGVRCGSLFKTVQGLELGGIVSHPIRSAGLAVSAGQMIEVRFKFVCRLLPATYFLNAGVVAMSDNGEEYLHRLIDAVMFRVLPQKDLSLTGLVDLMTGIAVSTIEVDKAGSGASSLTLGQERTESHKSAQTA